MRRPFIALQLTEGVDLVVPLTWVGSNCSLEEPLELPALVEGLGPIVQTKDGGFLRSMNPSLFRDAKNNGTLIMQVSGLSVVPAEMDSGIMEILQQLASVGIEKLTRQASKLMPLEDLTGKTSQRIAWDSATALDSCERSGNFVMWLSSNLVFVVGLFVLRVF